MIRYKLKFKAAILLLLVLSTVHWGCGSNPSSQPIIIENASKTGPVYASETWRGTIEITGDVTIYAPAIIIIDPGTIIRFAANSDDQKSGGTTPEADPIYFPHDPAIAPSSMCAIAVSGGTLNATGTADNKILFTSSSSYPTPGNWHSIQFLNKTGKLILKNTIIEYGYYGVQLSADLDDDHVIVKNNIIRHIVASGITFGSNPINSASITLLNNDISYCSHEGIATYRGQNITIESNVLHHNRNDLDGPSGAGIVLDGNNSTVINNRFEYNRFGIVLLGNSNPVMSGNTFSSNEADYK